MLLMLKQYVVSEKLHKDVLVKLTKGGKIGPDIETTAVVVTFESRELRNLGDTAYESPRFENVKLGMGPLFVPLVRETKTPVSATATIVVSSL